MSRWWRDDTRKRRLAAALLIYGVTVGVMLAVAGASRISSHTPYNHFALLAEAWLDGHLDLGGPPPSHAGMNDFARFDERWFVTFPPFPAVLLVPLVAWADGAAEVRDGQFFIWVAGIAPAALFLALEKLRLTGRSDRSPLGNAALALLFAFGSVYFFSSVQGTVWYAAHVVGAGLGALYLLFALDAQRPVLAGLMLGLGFATRTPLLFAFPLFALEAWRAASSRAEPPASEGSRLERARAAWRAVDERDLARRCLLFALPILLVGAASAWHNHARFGDPFEFGYRYLQIRWRTRIETWGLFDYHYLAKNLGVVLTSLPYRPAPGSDAPFQINGHGLALWVTTPLYLWLLWPKRTTAPHVGLWCTVLAVALPTLLYQNTGWVQFGYRFSNDYAVFLFALLAIGVRELARPAFAVAAAWSITINAFGAVTFERPRFRKYYFVEHTQQVLYQPDRPTR